MTHMLRIAGSLLLPLLVAVSPAAQAQTQETFRIGFVNPDRVLREAQPAKAAQAKLESEFLKREKDVKMPLAQLWHLFRIEISTMK